MSAKSSIKMLVPSDQQGQLFKWVALLTGSKNALKGVGFFLGGALLALWGFKGSVLIMAAALGLIWLASMLLLKRDLGKAKNKPKFGELFSKSRAINILSAARLFLFGARDIWFVVALPVFLSSQLGWNFWWVGGFLASWIIGYGIVQSFAPKIIGVFSSSSTTKFSSTTSPTTTSGSAPTGTAALGWAVILTLVTALMAFALSTSLSVTSVLITGLLVFGIVFAINSSLHSYLIVSYAKEDGASLDVGFYYMANAMGRLIGTLLSGYLYQTGGIIACLWVTTEFLVVVCVISLLLPKTHSLAP
jgi:hypothetical protein